MLQGARLFADAFTDAGSAQTACFSCGFGGFAAKNCASACGFG